MKYASHHIRQKANADAYSKAAGKSFDQSEDKCRHEEGEHADINNIVKRITAGHVVPMRETRFDVLADYTLDLDALHGAARDMGEMYNDLPPAVRKELTPNEFMQRALKLASLDPEQLKLELEAKNQPPKEATPVAPTQQGENTPKASA